MLVEALGLFESFGDRVWQANIRSNLGYAAIVAGDFGLARFDLAGLRRAHDGCLGRCSYRGIDIATPRAA